jgi:hypothetical protein
MGTKSASIWIWFATLFRGGEAAQHDGSVEAEQDAEGSISTESERFDIARKSEPNAEQPNGS